MEEVELISQHTYILLLHRFQVFLFPMFMFFDHKFHDYGYEQIFAMLVHCGAFLEMGWRGGLLHHNFTRVREFVDLLVV